MNAPGINFAYESGIKYKTILICDLIAREWQKNYENTRLEAYFGNKRKSPFAVIVSMIAKGDGPSGEAQTLGLAVPNRAFYQLNYTRIFSFCYYTTPQAKIKVFSCLWSFMWSKRFFCPV